MKKSYLTFIVLFLMIFGFNSHAQQYNSDGYAQWQNKRLGRGVNIIGYDDIWRDSSKARMKDKHFTLIKEAGFSNVRIVIMPFKFAKNNKDFKLAPSFFKTLDWAVEQALENDLMAIIDLHEHHAMQEDPIGIQPLFFAIWEQIAEHYKGHPSEVLFEIANEPNMDPQIWNQIHARAHKIIRSSNPDRTILIGTIYGNQIRHLKDLDLPVEDRNIIVAIHYYSPIQFTHQGAPWSTKNKDLSGITFTLTDKEVADIKEDFDVAQAWSAKNKRPLTLGEFGAYEKADMASRVRWTNFVAREAEARNWSWSYWQFDSDFIAYDIDKEEWAAPIKNALLGIKPEIFTVKGPVNPEDLGGSLTHEHIMSNFGAVPLEAGQYDERALFRQVIPYLRKLKSMGVNSIFDCTSAYFGRQPEILKTIADSTGLNIITNTGYYGAANDKYVPEFAIDASAVQIAEAWISEFENGIGDSAIKPGFIKLAFDDGAPSELDVKLFEAGVITHLETDMTLAVHTGNNKEAVEEQLRILNKYNVSLDNWVWVHASQLNDVEYLLKTASGGAWISLDGVKESNVQEYIEILKRFQAEKLLHRVLLSHDGNGFPGGGKIRPFTSVLEHLIPAMRDSGFTSQEVGQIIIHNPKRAFEIKGKK